MLYVHPFDSAHIAYIAPAAMHSKKRNDHSAQPGGHRQYNELAICACVRACVRANACECVHAGGFNLVNVLRW